MTDLKPGIAPNPVTLSGQYCRLEPLGLHHAPSLFAAISGPEIDARHRYVFEYPPANQQELEAWLRSAANKPDPMFFAVVDQATGACGGRQALMSIVPEHGVIEVGSIVWGQGIARTRIATEAIYLTAKHIFDDLGYRRFEWKCHADNEPSRRAATRFGFTFEGVFRQHKIAKNANRNTAWFSMLDSEWPALRAEYERWLAPDNFDAEGNALTRLNTPRL